MVFNSLNPLFCPNPSSSQGGRGNAQGRRQKDRPGSCSQPSPQEADVGAPASWGSLWLRAQPSGPNGPPPSKARCASCPWRENRSGALCPACPLPAGSFTWIYRGSFHASMHTASSCPASAGTSVETKECVLSLQSSPRGPSMYREHPGWKEGAC